MEMYYVDPEIVTSAQKVVDEIPNIYLTDKIRNDIINAIKSIDNNKTTKKMLNIMILAAKSHKLNEKFIN